MREHKGDLWADFGHPYHRIAISTNGFVKRDGRAVMGRGCAKQATQLFRGIELLLGAYIKTNGNIPGYLLIDGESSLPTGDRLMILPVKHNWWERADATLVKRSIAFLAYEAGRDKQWTFHVPRLGCGNGKLDWGRLVKPWMDVLPDNVVVHF